MGPPAVARPVPPPRLGDSVSAVGTGPVTLHLVLRESHVPVIKVRGGLAGARATVPMLQMRKQPSRPLSGDMMTAGTDAETSAAPPAPGRVGSALRSSALSFSDILSLLVWTSLFPAAPAGVWAAAESPGSSLRCAPPRGRPAAWPRPPVAVRPAGPASFLSWPAPQSLLPRPLRVPSWEPLCHPGATACLSSPQKAGLRVRSPPPARHFSTAVRPFLKQPEEATARGRDSGPGGLSAPRSSGAPGRRLHAGAIYTDGAA